MRALGFGKKVLQSDVIRSEALPKAAPTWRKSLLTPAPEFSAPKLSVISGEIPKSLNGTLFRNGPGRITRGKDKVKHWVDGDGAILGVNFQNGEASATYKYIQTKGYQEEEKANKFIYAGLGQPMQLPFWKRPLIQEFKNTGNTSLLPIQGKLLAFWEGGLPHSLDLQTLETNGLEKLDFLTDLDTFSAHPKVCPITKEVYNFGFKKGPKMELGVYKFDQAGKLIKSNTVPTRFNIMHDCVIAGKYLIIMNFPTKVSNLPSILFGFKPMKDMLKWAPELGTEVMVFDRNDMSLVNRFTIDPMYSCHFTNGYEEKDGSVYLELITYNSYDDFNDYVTGVPNFDEPLPPGLTSKLHSMRLDPVQGKLLGMKQLSGPGVEFPNVADAMVGQKWRYSLLSMGSSQNAHAADDQFGAIGRYDSKTQNIQVYEYGQDMYATEPSLSSFEEDPENGHVMTLVYDAKAEKSEVWIHDTRSFEQEPVCRLALPSIVPLGFHGKWQARS